MQNVLPQRACFITLSLSHSANVSTICYQKIAKINIICLSSVSTVTTKSHFYIAIFVILNCNYKC